MDTTAIAILLIATIVLVAILGVRFNELQARVGVLYRIEAKLDLLLKQGNLKYDPYGSLPSDIVQAVRDRKKIQAIKLYRQKSGVGLKEAKDFIEEVQRRAGLA